MRPDSEGLQKVSVRADVLALLREKRYEDALALLYRARAESPADRELQKSIDQIKEFLVGVYAKRLGGLDRVATPIPASAVRSPDVVMLVRYIDGTSTFGDIAQMCPLGQLRTLQVLVGLYSVASPLSRIDPEPPNSGLRSPSEPPAAAHVTIQGVTRSGRQTASEIVDDPQSQIAPSNRHNLAPESDDLPAPDTARSASFIASAPVPALSAAPASSSSLAPQGSNPSSGVTPAAFSNGDFSKPAAGAWGAPSSRAPKDASPAPAPGSGSSPSWNTAVSPPSFGAPSLAGNSSGVPSSASVIPAFAETFGPFSRAAPETEDTRRYKQLFAQGTAAFVQNRFGDAVEAFEGCVRLRPDDNAAAVMLRRALRELGTQIG